MEVQLLMHLLTNSNKNMKTKTKKITHIQTQRVEGVAVKQFLIDMMYITEFDFNLMQYEFGLLFLQELFPRENETYLKHNEEHERDANFWKWWGVMWHIESQSIVSFICEHSVNFTYQMFYDEMIQIVHSSVTEMDFYKYLKTYQNGRC